MFHSIYYGLMFCLIMQAAPVKPDLVISYNIVVSDPVGEDASISYEIVSKSLSTGEELIIETNSLDSFTSYLIDDLSQLEEGKNQVLLYIHGMWGGNNFLFNRTVRLLHEAYIYPEHSDIGRLMAIRWPGNALEYENNKANVKKVADEIAEVLLSITRSVQLYDYLDMEFSTGIDVIAHSLGNELFREIYKAMPATESNYVMFDQVVLAAPDLDNGLFDEGGELFEMHRIANGISVYFSRRDMTLSVSENLNGKGRLGVSGPTASCSASGKLCFIDVSMIQDENNLRERLVGHSYFRSSPAATRDILGSLMGIKPGDVISRSCVDDALNVFSIIPGS